ncbi:MAG: hypothetical protein M0Z42_13575, partial [Actinomycetota bacterium]|nr:hypothetical protein [Actinomycetota bacterium]
VRGPAVRGPAVRGPAVRGPAVRGKAVGCLAAPIGGTGAPQELATTITANSAAPDSAPVTIRWRRRPTGSG